jgi:di/tricarboxylate transporter
VAYPLLPPGLRDPGPVAGTAEGTVAESIVLAAILAAALVLFWTQRVGTDVTALLVMLALIVPWPHPGGAWRAILTYQEGFSGFGSAAVVMVTAMFVVGAAIVRTGAAEVVGIRLFRACARREWLLQLAVLGMSTLASMFINDTTVVLIFLPLITTVCEEKGLSPSRFLIFAAYGSLLGGQWTLIGTRSNLILSDYLRGRSGHGLGFFDFTPIAALVFVVAAAYVLLLGRRLLPASRPPRSAAETNSREYLTEVEVIAESSAIGKRADELGWSERDDLTVVSVHGARGPLPSWSRLAAGDQLIIRGRVSAIGELLKSSDFKVQQEVELDRATLESVDLVTVEALLAPNSYYEGLTLDRVDLGRIYGFTVMGISRHGRQLRGRPSEIRLQFGDSLLVLGNIGDLERLRRNPHLILLGEEKFPAVGRRKAAVVGLLLAAMIVAAVTGALAAPIAIPLAAVAAVLLGCVRIRDAYAAINWEAVLTVAGMIPFGLALEKTGASQAIAAATFKVFAAYGPLALFGGLLLLATLVTQFIENAAVAIILAPLGYQLAKAAGADPKAFMVGLAVCVSTAFCTPIAHESTILVMGPGGYRFEHYLRLGAALALLTWLITTFTTGWFWPLAH